MFRFLPALMAMIFFAAPAAAQEGGARRNNTVTARQETKAEKKQEKVDKAQYPTNVSNQAATDVKLRVTTDREGSRRNGSDDRNSGSSNSGYSNGGSLNNGGSSASHSGNNGYNSGNNNRPANSGSNNHNGNNSGYNAGNNRPANGGNNGHNGNSGYNNGRPVNGGNNGYNSGNHGGSYNNGYIPGYADMYPGKRPPIPTVRNYSRYEAYERTNAAGIVVNTLFTSKMEAYDYIARLLGARYYSIGSYGNNYDWIRSEVSFIPTPFDWTNPMTHNQFAMYFKITRVFGRVKVTITAQWRESVLSDRFSTLRFQPSNAYSTYYAWNVLEDIADNIPNTGVSYRTADLL